MFHRSLSGTSVHPVLTNPLPGFWLNAENYFESWHHDEIHHERDLLSEPFEAHSFH